ncbi:flagellar biosynthetic protein FliP [Candidatus Epulonipiscium fishelsonii]|uniref:Flagellar biosynthetic protein FliP n=1 Tax=Candidatus Epulonipiscium fishelsonii TaxID=77094 RepID=A0ACC8XJ97_9FIRM|nr:flagellar biosynthetic protein FliP [Epulopiscium sp. SCG-D08WGA-EpuloA1]OON91674.1 MAG: flagellar biosynthetic protein FliP [Epulopiscium sp. AS2M-Bin002]
MRRKVKLWIVGFFVLFPYNVWATNLLEPPAELTVTLQMLFFITLLALIPSILVMMTSFTRFIISLHFLKSAMGTQQMPPNQIVLGLALFLTFFVMSPVFSEINNEAIIPYRNNQINQQEMLDRSVVPLKEFMIAQARDEDIKLFMDLSGMGLIEDETDILSQIPLYILVPAFIIGELRAGFIIGFLIYLPFIVIDMVIASALMAMGMMMLPPATISLPFKILLFILADGWNLLIGELVLTFN